MEQKGEQKKGFEYISKFLYDRLCSVMCCGGKSGDPFIMTKFAIKLDPITSKAPSRQEETDKRKHIVLISQAIVR